MKNKKINFGIIGCSRISSQHFGSIQLYKDELNLAALCDKTELKAKEYGEKYKTKWYTDYNKMLTQDDIDIVSICTPNGLHAEMGIAAANAGKHALIEKPLALNTTEIDEIIKAFEKNQKKLFVVKQVRYNPAVIIAKKAIEEGKFGKLYSGALTIRWTRPQAYFDEVNWRGTKKLDGGALLNQGDHYVDILQWFFGPVKNVFAKIDTVAHNTETEDEAYAILQFTNGAYATLEFSINTYPKNLECSLTVMGSKGTIKIGGKAIDKFETWEVEDYPEPQIQNNIPPQVYELGLFQGSSPRHIFVYRSIIDHFSNYKDVAMDGREARKSVEIIEAIYESAKTKQQVELPIIK
ncbi:Gfo/Idh/MocA family oxidoreductase [Patescibacteria group bacterium]|nr:Gfo/Idh/MocA family oxidoreductase [Patescibacteria group bacterium]MBU0963457.1 Gfo/Idh/MocA family oxidoreductase [Patescibacteria group bacterium]